MDCLVSGNIDDIFSKLEKFLKAETVVGKKVSVGDVTLIPLINVLFGCAAGGGLNSNIDGVDTTFGAGSGKISSSGILVIKGEDVILL